MNYDQIIVLGLANEESIKLVKVIRKQNVLCKLLPYETKADELYKIPYLKGIIISHSTSLNSDIELDNQIFNMKIPVLGVLSGMNMMLMSLGANLGKWDTDELKYQEIKVNYQSDLIAYLSSQQIHQVAVQNIIKDLPNGFTVNATNDVNQVIIVSDDLNRFYGVNFIINLEINDNIQILQNFLFDICGCENNWRIGNIIINLSNMIKNETYKRDVYCVVTNDFKTKVLIKFLSEIIAKRLILVMDNFISGHELLKELNAPPLKEISLNDFNNMIDNDAIVIIKSTTYYTTLSRETLEECDTVIHPFKDLLMEELKEFSNQLGLKIQE